jgi:Flp pilus assembly protein TadD
MTADPFDYVHALVKKDELDKALREVLDAATGQINLPYCDDENHAWYVVGDILARQENWIGAKEAFRKAIQDRPDDVQALLGLAYAYTELRDFGGARDVLLNAQRLDPTNSAVLYNLGNAYFDLGEYEKAKFFYVSVTQERDSELWKKAQKNYELSIQRLSELDSP